LLLSSWSVDLLKVSFFFLFIQLLNHSLISILEFSIVIP
jgi:hypothetical protein